MHKAFAKILLTLGAEQAGEEVAALDTVEREDGSVTWVLVDTGWVRAHHLRLVTPPG